MSTYYVVALRDTGWYRDQVLTSGCQASRSHFLVHLNSFVHTYAVNLWGHLQFILSYLWGWTDRPKPKPKPLNKIWCGSTATGVCVCQQYERHTKQMIKPQNTHFTPWHFVFATACAVKVPAPHIHVIGSQLANQSASQHCRFATNQCLKIDDLRPINVSRVAICDTD